MTRHRSIRPSLAVLQPLAVLVLLLVSAGCGPGAPAEHQHHPGAPAGASASGPSEASRMVCGGFVLRQLAGALGGEPVTAPVGSWDGRVYSCPYVYAEGVLLLSVRESGAAVGADFEALRDSGGEAREVAGLGEAAFVRADGSTVVRKDGMVLVVDVSGLPEAFGSPARGRADVSVMAATTVMTCWKQHLE